MGERFGQQKEFENAALVSFELEVVSTKVDRFGWRDLSQDMKQRLSDDWTSALRDYPIAEVKRGISDCLDENPRRCPNEHEVKAKVIKRRGQAMAKAPKQPELIAKSEVTEGDKAERAEAARRIMKEVMGYED